MPKNILKNKKECAFCGDAPINHTFSYISSVLSYFVDSTFKSLSSLVPKAFVLFLERILDYSPNILLKLRILSLSKDKEKSATLRSRIIWDEAERRGIDMEQIIFAGIYTDNYRAKINDRYYFFNSLPIPPRYNTRENNWDDKIFFKKVLSKNNIPVPLYKEVPISKRKQKSFFDTLPKPFILKPRTGSRGRHTTVNINTYEEYLSAIKIGRKISVPLVVEEYLDGYICRATIVEGKIAGFYRADTAQVIGDGEKTVLELIEEKNKNRGEKIREIKVSEEMRNFIKRSGYELYEKLPKGKELKLSYRSGRYFGGETKEMLDGLHPSFVDYFQKAGKLTGLPVVGLDVIMPDPEKSESKQKWGIIECNTLPFIDLHYFALEGKPQNIAGMIWDLWNK